MQVNTKLSVLDTLLQQQATTAGAGLVTASPHTPALIGVVFTDPSIERDQCGLVDAVLLKSGVPSHNFSTATSNGQYSAMVVVVRIHTCRVRSFNLQPTLDQAKAFSRPGAPIFLIALDSRLGQHMLQDVPNDFEGSARFVTAEGGIVASGESGSANREATARLQHFCNQHCPMPPAPTPQARARTAWRPWS